MAAHRGDKRAGQPHEFEPIYIKGGCVGLDTSGEESSPLSCLRVETFTLYQAYPSGLTEVRRLGNLKPDGARPAQQLSQGKLHILDGAR